MLGSVVECLKGVPGVAQESLGLKESRFWAQDLGI